MYLFPLYLPSITHLKIEQKTTFYMCFNLNAGFKYVLNMV